MYRKDWYTLYRYDSDRQTSDSTPLTMVPKEIVTNAMKVLRKEWEQPMKPLPTRVLSTSTARTLKTSSENVSTSAPASDTTHESYVCQSCGGLSKKEDLKRVDEAEVLRN